MTTAPASESLAPLERSAQRRRPASLRWLNDMPIGRKLTLGFAALVLLTVVLGTLNWYASWSASSSIARTNNAHVPTALAASRAQADLLRMTGDVRGYLALGDTSDVDFRSSYLTAREAFSADLAALKAQRASLDSVSQQRLDELLAAFARWSDPDWEGAPDTLFALRDDQLEREPAYRLLTIDGSKLAGSVLVETNALIGAEAGKEATPERLARLKRLAEFQGSFAAMFSGLRGYVTTRNRIFREEYDANYTINDLVWSDLWGRRDQLEQLERDRLQRIYRERDRFLQTIPQQMFAQLGGEGWRKDLHLFSQETIPLANKMQGLLQEITQRQQQVLQNDLAAGTFGLARANRSMLVGAIVALLLGTTLSLVFRATLIRPIRGVTRVAEQISAGDLSVQAVVESRDEVGTLARTFNTMTGRLSQTLDQVRREKRRADDLLEVVIPIGVALSNERDFNRLLETILGEARTFCNADGGTLYLRTEDDQLRFMIVHNDSLGLMLGGASGNPVPFAPLPLRMPDGSPNSRNVAVNTVLSGQPINIPDTATCADYDFRGLDSTRDEDDHYVRSMLSIPLKNSSGAAVGAIQLINAQDATGASMAFDSITQQMMESLSSLAVAALEGYVREQSLRQEIKQLRIEIDEAKSSKQVEEITETDFFRNLATRATAMRRGRKGAQGSVELLAEETQGPG
jgi:CHASE3 domain sensor protein/HAMP domain-containing protein